MRLICPNCDAHYEVPDTVVPIEGRDVQCSNCGTTWFQDHPDNPQELDQPEQAAPIRSPVPSPPGEAPTAPEKAAPKSRRMDDAVEKILRAEAEREEEARAQEADSIETQPDLGLAEVDGSAEKRAEEARSRMAKIKGETTASIAAPVAAAAAMDGDLRTRRELLPDIEEINSSLRSASERPISRLEETEKAHQDQPHRRSGGFRTGFFTVVLLAVIAVLVYVFAPQIAEVVPQADPYLTEYVGLVDTARLWFDGQVSKLLTWLDEVAASSQSPAN